MSKLLIISDNARNAIARAEGLGLSRNDITIVTTLEKIHGYRDMLMVYAGECYQLPEFFEIVDYAGQHDIKALKLNDPTKDTIEVHHV